MSYIARDDRPADKAARYAEVEEEIMAVLEGEPDRVARMATVASMLADAFPAFFWTGFYVVDPDKGNELVVGPYQGTLGCDAHHPDRRGRARLPRPHRLRQPLGQRDRDARERSVRSADRRPRHRRHREGGV